MASNQNNNNTRNQQQKDEEKSGSGWFVPAVLGAAVGAGLAYVFSKSQPQSCSEQRQLNSSCGQSGYEAAPRGCCSICRDDYDATITMQCGHILHRDCYEELKRASRGVVFCPLCRKRAE